MNNQFPGNNMRNGQYMRYPQQVPPPQIPAVPAVPPRPVAAPPQYCNPPMPPYTACNMPSAPVRMLPPSPPPAYSLAFKKANESRNNTLLVALVAIFSVAFSDVVFSAGLWQGYGIGLSLLFVLFYALFSWGIIRGKKHKLASLLMLIPELLFASVFAFAASPASKTVAAVSAVLLFILQTSVMGGCTRGGALSLSAAATAISTHLGYTFANIGSAFNLAFLSSEKKAAPAESAQKGGLSLGAKMLIGLGISAPIVVIMLFVFSSVDPMFGEMMGKLLSNIIDYLPRVMIDIIIGAVVFCFFLPLVMTLRAGYVPQGEKKELSRKLDGIIASIVLFAVSAVYIIFSAIQFTYLFSSDKVTLPNSMTYAEYGRRGFAELCVVVSVSLIAIGLVVTFVERGANGGVSLLPRIALTVFTLCNFVVVASAAMRMYRYVDVYGLTVKRVICAVMIIACAAALVLMLLKIWIKKFNVTACLIALAMAAALTVSVVDVDAVVASYNVDRYMSGEMKEIDTYYLSNLSDAAAPALERLLDSDNDDAAKAARSALAKFAGRAERNKLGLVSWNLDSQRARDIIEARGIESDDYEFLDLFFN